MITLHQNVPNMPTDEEPDCDDANPASLQMMTQDYYPVDSEGGTTSFLPSKEKTGGRSITFKTETMCLTEKQTDYVYKTIEEGNIINTKTMMFETVQNQGDNPYKKVVLNNVLEGKTNP